MSTDNEYTRSEALTEILIEGHRHAASVEGVAFAILKSEWFATVKAEAAREALEAAAEAWDQDIAEWDGYAENFLRARAAALKSGASDE